MLSFPKDTAQFSWTKHIKNKMVFYHLSSAQILRIFRKPQRREEGIAPNTVAAMQTKKAVGAKQARSEELWIMYRLNAKRNSITPSSVTRSTLRDTHPASSDDTRYKLQATRPSRITMISAWRYPGITKVGDRPPIPLDILEALENDETL